MILGEKSASADYWRKCGDEALARNIKGILIIVGADATLPGCLCHGDAARGLGVGVPAGGRECDFEAFGPAVADGMTKLMKHPRFRDAHVTDDHIIPAMFVAGVVSDLEDIGSEALMPAEDWELTNMCNSQFTLGVWGKAIAA
ncbi:LigB subunit of an aromatic-ring-opening dioxygenase LigAB [Penicillium cataractarum]|uniref:LigB subunit of an aromatic-ring-opening dioxygenase LigAB n=1 Tax=Penicillium cataractarum TaxID=2100454 RepID=A0A9W9UZY5_9EURO|nr:LigB subunit of an aromatic-ring-opening dioxygenase LigAB [Penicillium cataractarum]KAJ5363758.1 LigB subunit of an aromatic-ring-opening dioxygenase LigAB [Penicillium cataractarum]